MAEIHDEVPVLSFLLGAAKVGDETAAEQIVSKPEERPQAGEDEEMTLIDLFEGDDREFIVASVQV
jgi:hypothetical protein